MPAIRRIVFTEAVALPESRFLNGAALEFGGTTAYTVLYLGDDDSLFCASLTSDYTASLALGDAPVSDVSTIGIDTSVENVTCRVTGPRRLTLRCRMRTRVTSLAPHTAVESVRDTSGTRGTPADEVALERLCADAPDLCVFRGAQTTSVTGTLNLGAGAKILRCTGAFRTESARAGAGCITVKGDAILTALCRAADGTYFSTNARAPMEESISVPDAAEGDLARAWGRCAAVTVQTPEGGQPTWEIELDLEAEAARPAKHAFTADAYSTSCACTVEMAECDSLNLLRHGNGALSFSGTGGRQSKPVPGEYILGASATPSPDHFEVSGGKLILHGACAVCVWIAADGDVVSEEFTLPFRYETESASPEADSELLSRCAVTVCSVSARLDGEKIAVDLDLDFCMSVAARQKIRYVESVVLDRAKPTTPSASQIRVCYPDPGVPLWEIAKRYGVSRRMICEANDLPDPAVPCTGDALIV